MSSSGSPAAKTALEVLVLSWNLRGKPRWWQARPRGVVRGVSHDEPVPEQFISNFMTRWGWVVTFLCLPVRFLYRILQCFMCVINFSKVSTLFSFPPPSLRRYFTKTSENGKAIENSILKTPVYFGERGKTSPIYPPSYPNSVASSLLENVALRRLICPHFLCVLCCI